MKILVLTTSFPLVRESLSGIFIKKMVEHLGADFQVTVLTPDSSREPDSVTGYSLIRFRYGPKKWQQLAHGSGGIMTALTHKHPACLLLPVMLGAEFLACLRHGRHADIIHANWSINGVIAGIAGIINRKPVVTSLRGTDVNLMHSSRLMRILVYLCLLLSDRIVTVSPSLKQLICDRFPKYRAKVLCIGNGIDDVFFKKQKKLCTQDEPVRLRPVRLLTVGNITAGKGIDCILGAVASLPTDNWMLDILGDGPEREKLEQYCKENNIQSKVIFHGAVAPDDVPGFMHRADLFVFASRAEGRPNVVLEAMASGLVVIAGDIPAVLDLIKDGEQGFIYPVGDVVRLGELLDDCIMHPMKRLEMGQKARKHILDMGLSWTKSANRYGQVYTELVH